LGGLLKTFERCFRAPGEVLLILSSIISWFIHTLGNFYSFGVEVRLGIP
jgi:hypothetical protein